MQSGHPAAVGEGKKWAQGAQGRAASSTTLKIDVLEVEGAAVAAVEEPGADEVGQTRAGVVLALPEERDLGRDESVGARLRAKSYQPAPKIPGSSQRFNRHTPEINF